MRPPVNDVELTSSLLAKTGFGQRVSGTFERYGRVPEPAGQPGHRGTDVLSALEVRCSFLREGGDPFAVILCLLSLPLKQGFSIQLCR